MATKQSAKLLAQQISKFDHRLINTRQKLFFFDPSSKGSCFFLPPGTRIINKLKDFLRDEYKRRNYHEVITPNLFDCKLWEKSGHWSYYEENMITLKLGDKAYSLKPMNCPAHCIIYYNQMTSSSKQTLPIRLADFGTLHRNELSGSLAGLMRLRRFCQDDAHIFCRQDQIESEILNCLKFAGDVYQKFNLHFDLRLSLRPEQYLGDSQTWDQAEDRLRNALRNSGLDFREQALEGAFYGPKIDIVVRDTMKREHQCATIQLDLQLAKRFDLQYQDQRVESDEDCDVNTLRSGRPVIIHRAILGSLERFMAILAESCLGRWPFWLSPFQAKIIPVHSEFNDYAKQVSQQLREANFWVDADLSTSTFNAKIREASLMPYNLILIVGKRELESKSVTTRSTNNKTRTITVDKLINAMRTFETTKVHRADIELETYEFS